MRAFPPLLLPASLAAVILACLIIAIPTRPALLAGEKAVPAPIWRIDDEDSTVFLAGTIHLLRAKDMPIPEAFDRVYEQADELVFEIDFREMSRPGAAVAMRRAGSLPAGETLSDHLSEETVTALASYLEERGLPANVFEGLRPGMIYLTLASLEATRQGARPDLGLEVHFYRRSVNDGKPSRGLESTRFQISRFDEIDREVLEEMIRESLEDEGEDAEALDEIVAAWKSGDEARIAELTVDRFDETPEVRDILLIDRNENWIPEILEELETEDDVLFLLGAAHLAGEDSVVDLLRERGFEVRQVGRE